MSGSLRLAESVSGPRAGVDPGADGEPRTVLLVCTGNLCRSPMAAALLRRMLSDLGLEDRVRVASAGVAAADGRPAAALAVEVAGESGLDLTVHLSRALDAEAMRRADLVITMESIQRESLLRGFPDRAGRIHLLGSLAGEADDVVDPYGTGSIAAYRECLQRLRSLLARALPQILDLLGIQGSHSI